MTGSRTGELMLRSWNVPVDLYVMKPVDLRAIAEIVRRVDDLTVLIVRAS